MNKPSSLLQIQIRGTDGSLAAVTTHDRASSGLILTELQRPDFFSRERVIIVERASLTSLATSKIARIDLTGEGLAAWNPKSPADTPEFIEVSEQEFLSEREAYDLKHDGRRGQRLTTGQRFSGLLDVHVVGSQHIYMKLFGVTALPAERLQKVHYLLTMPGLWFRSPGAGVGLVHLTAATKFTVYPGPAEVPADAWLAFG